MASIPEELLEKVKNKAILRRGLETLKLPYAFVITDGEGILAVDTLSYKIPMRKGRLILRHEEIVLNKVKDRPVDFELPSDVVKEEKYYNVLSPHPNTMVGLTRRERQLKQLLFMGLDSVYSDENHGKLKYLYSEWDIENYTNVKDLSLDELFKKFVAEVSKGWSKQHQELTKLITYDQPFYKKLYEIETA
jgi:hypothetical protein